MAEATIPRATSSEVTSYYDPEAEKIKTLVVDPVFEYDTDATGNRKLKRGEIPRENKEENWGTTGTNFKLQNTDDKDRRVLQCRIRARHLSHRIWKKRNEITPEWLMRQEEQKIYDLAAINRTKEGETNMYINTQRIHQLYEDVTKAANSTVSKIREGIRGL